MRLLIVTAGAALALAACSSNKTDNNAMATDANMSADSNMMMDSNMASDPNMMGADMNATGGMDGNMATNSATENAMMQKDMKTHDHDTNLANGM